MEKGDDIKDEIGIFKFLSKRDLWNSQLSSHSPESVRYNLVVCGNSSSIKMKLMVKRFVCLVITAKTCGLMVNIMVFLTIRVTVIIIFNSYEATLIHVVNIISHKRNIIICIGRNIVGITMIISIAVQGIDFLRVYKRVT